MMETISRDIHNNLFVHTWKVQQKCLRAPHSVVITRNDSIYKEPLDQDIILGQESCWERSAADCFIRGMILGGQSRI